jgi:DNA mismatch repair ATPase MutL
MYGCTHERTHPSARAHTRTNIRTRTHIQVVGKYSIRFPHVSFTCKRAGENVADVRTSVASTSLDNIRNVYGAAIGKELLEVIMCMCMMMIMCVYTHTPGCFANKS